MRIRCLWVLLLLIAGMLAARAEINFAAAPADLDLPNCRAFVNGKAQAPVAQETLEVFLGLRPMPRERVEWTTGDGVGRDRAFRVAFNKPVKLGTICTYFSGGTPSPEMPPPAASNCVSYLKPAAAYPGDVAKDDQWLTLPAGELKTLPPGVTTRAVRFTVRNRGEEHDPSKMNYALLLAERCYSALNLGGVKYSHLMKKPEGWMGSWREPQEVSGLIFMYLNTDAKVEVLKTRADMHPLIAPAGQWMQLAQARYAPMPQVYRFDRPITTRAVRLTGAPIEWAPRLGTVYPLVILGEQPNVPSLVAPPPPFQIKYDMPMDGFIAMDIMDAATNQRVRRLVAEVERDKGPNLEAWDLKDDTGALVPPGKYVAKAVTRPPFKLTYEMSVNNAGQPAWWAPAPGKGGGGWLADHGAPYTATAMGNTLWFGAQCAESGHVVAVTDLDGNKLWGRIYMSWGFSGPDVIATDGRYGYLVNSAQVDRVDPQNEYATKTIWNFKGTTELPENGMYARPGYCGAAAKDGKLYVTTHAKPESWLKPSFLSEAIDPQKCLPLIRLAKGNGKRQRHDPIYNESEYDELMKLYAAFLTDYTPSKTPTMPDTFIPSSTQACFGDAPEEGPLAGTLTVTFTKPVPVGSIVLPDANTAVYALKPGAKLPDSEPEAGEVDIIGGGGGGGEDTDPFDEQFWVPLNKAAKPNVPAGAPGIAAAAEGGVNTTALRFKTKRLSFALVLSHRMEDVAPQAERVLGEGAPTKQGGWNAAREVKSPINPFNPAMMALVWPQAVALRGVSLVNPSTATMAVDYWVGPADGDPKAALANDKLWKEAGVIQQEIFTGQYFPQKATLRSVDFGEVVTTRAVRVRALSTERLNGKATAGFQAIVASRPLGGDPAGLPVILPERITEFQLPGEDGSGMKVLREIPFRKPGFLTFGPGGELYAVSDGQVVTVPLKDGEKSRVVIKREEVEKPNVITFDAEGQLYVGDGGPKVIKVFDPKTGKLLRTLGKPGGQHVGKWDPECFDDPTGLAVDSAGKLWVVDNSHQPKRVERMTRDGKPEKWLLGPTRYGGGGWLDEKDKNVLIYNGMKFVIDWTKRDWKLDSIMFRPGDPKSISAQNPERIIYSKGKRYVVGEAGGGARGGPGAIAVICREENGIAIPMAAAGSLGNWDDVVTRPDLRQAFGDLDRDNMSFVWSDLNGDGKPQVAEVQTTDQFMLSPFGFFSRVGEDLAFVFHGMRLRPTSIRADGVPLYDIARAEKLPLLDQNNWETEDGRNFVVWDRLLAPDGKTELWNYEDKYAVHAGFYVSGWGYDRPPGKLNAEQSLFGHLKLNNAQGKEEEYFIVSSDQGDWFTFTNDGFLVGCLFGGPTGYGRRQWTMPEWEPGKVDLTDLRLGQEHYQGCVVKADDGKVYAVAGHNHVSIVRIDGLESLQRVSAPLTVTAEDIQKAQAWDVQRAAIENIKKDPKLAKAVYVNGGIEVNGSLDDWPDDLFFNIHDYWKLSLYSREFIVHSQAAFSCDENNLYIAARVSDDSPLRNSCAPGDLKTLFKYGDALDIFIGLDPKADPARKGPAPGDVRILVAMVKGNPTAMIFRYNVPGADPAKGQRYKSPVGETYIDVVEELKDAQVTLKQERINADTDGWVAEIAIPWKSLGAQMPPVNSVLRADVGVLQSDQNGMRTAGRLYWSGKSQTVICDVPSEARIAPILWGDVVFMEPDNTMKFGPEDTELVP